VSEPWELLWDRAMVALDSLQPGFKAGVFWSFGGATAMRMFYDHRDSKDIDIFVTDALVISGLSPRLNDTTERQVGSNYNEQSNIVKLRFPEGEVDFIIGGHLVPAVPYERMTIRGREANVERPIEVSRRSASTARPTSRRATSSTSRSCSTRNPVSPKSTAASCSQSMTNY
jgi:hypothetical protein